MYRICLAWSRLACAARLRRSHRLRRASEPSIRGERPCSANQHARVRSKLFPRWGPAGEGMLSILVRQLPPRHGLFRRFAIDKALVARPARRRNSKFNRRGCGGFPQEPHPLKPAFSGERASASRPSAKSSKPRRRAPRPSRHKSRCYCQTPCPPKTGTATHRSGRARFSRSRCR